MAEDHKFENLQETIRNFDRIGAVSLALRSVEDGSTSISSLYDELSRILVETGAGWQRGTLEVWREHLVTGIVRNIVEACVMLVEEHTPREPTATVLLAAPDDEYHDLGLRMLADRFVLAGWRTHFLGPTVPVGQLIDAVRKLDAQAVAVSASTHFHRLAAERYVTDLRRAHPELRIWVGGPAFALDNESWPPEMVLDPRAVPTPEEK